jgi:hypothetical protein
LQEKFGAASFATAATIKKLLYATLHLSRLSYKAAFQVVLIRPHLTAACTRPPTRRLIAFGQVTLSKK